MRVGIMFISFRTSILALAPSRVAATSKSQISRSLWMLEGKLAGGLAVCKIGYYMRLQQLQDRRVRHSAALAHGL